MHDSLLRKWVPILALLPLLAACASDDGLNEPLFEEPETAVEYTTEIVGLPNEEMTELARQALATFRREDEGAQSVPFLKRRAENDKSILQRLLRSRGYYEGEIEAEVTSAPPAEGEEPGAKETAKVAFAVEPGPQFTLAGHEITVTSRGPAPELSAVALNDPETAYIGGPALAAEIVDTETRALAALRDAGFPYARKGERRAVADLEADTIEVTTAFDAGPLSVYGPLTFEGLDEVQEEYLRTYLDFEAGQTFSQKALEDYQGELLSTDLFDTISVRAPEDAPDGEAPVPLPITVTADERKKRTIGAALRFNTDDGPSILLSYENRNVFGSNETFTTEAEAGLDIQRLTFGYRIPQFQRDGQDFVTGLNLQREEDDAFDALSATFSAGSNAA